MGVSQPVNIVSDSSEDEAIVEPSLGILHNDVTTLEIAVSSVPATPVEPPPTPPGTPPLPGDDQPMPLQRILSETDSILEVQSLSDSEWYYYR